MTTKATGEGEIIPYANSSGSTISANTIVAIGTSGRIGIVLADIADGDTGSVAIEGRFTLPKASGTAWSYGDLLDFDASAAGLDKAIATPATGDVENCAMCVTAAASGDTTGDIILVEAGGTAH